MLYFILGVIGICIAFLGFVSFMTALCLMVEYVFKNGLKNTTIDMLQAICRMRDEVVAGFISFAKALYIVEVDIAEQIKRQYRQAVGARKRRRKEKYKKTLKYKVDRLSRYFFRSQSEIQFLKARVEELEKTQYLTYCCPGDGSVQIYANGAWRNIG